MYRDHSVSTGTGLIMVDEDGLNTIVDGDSACAALTWDETHAAIEAMKEAQVFITGFGMPFRKAPGRGEDRQGGVRHADAVQHQPPAPPSQWATCPIWIFIVLNVH